MLVENWKALHWLRSALTFGSGLVHFQSLTVALPNADLSSQTVRWRHIISSWRKKGVMTGPVTTVT